MLIVNVDAATKPESNPAEVLLVAARYVHGFWKDDWVTECMILPVKRRNAIQLDVIVTRTGR